MRSKEGVMNQPLVIDETRLDVGAASQLSAPVALED